MAIFDQEHRPTEPCIADALHAFARSGLDALPYVGAACAELLTLVVAPSLERRRHEWMEDVRRKPSCGSSRRSEDYSVLRRWTRIQRSSTLHSTREGLVTSQAAKQEALRNAVLKLSDFGSARPRICSTFSELVEDDLPNGICTY